MTSGFHQIHGHVITSTLTGQVPKMLKIKLTNFSNTNYCNFQRFFKIKQHIDEK